MTTWLLGVPAGLLVLAVLFYTLRVRSLEAQLSRAQDAARGSAERARQLENALTGLRDRLEKEAEDDTAAGDSASASPASAGSYLRDSLRDPAKSPSALRRMPAPYLAHRARFVPGFGRGR